MPTVPRLQVITDETVQNRFTHVELTRLAVAGGAPCVQFREKRPRTTAELIRTATAMHELCTAEDRLLLVNDRADVALSVGCGALHLGRHDLDVATARRILGDDAIIGGTANSLAEAESSWHSGIDYLGVGPIYGTKSKANPAPTMGLETLSQIAAASPVPVIAIGSITAARIPEVLATGAYGVAVLSFIACAKDPAEATGQCMQAVNTERVVS